MSKRFKLTADSVKKRCPLVGPNEVDADGKAVVRRIYWDSTLPGFGLVVGRRSKTFYAQADVRGKSVRVRIGRLGEKDPDDPTGRSVFTPSYCRDKAMLLLPQMRAGVNPNIRRREETETRAAAERKEEWQVFTLRDALDEHVANMEADDCAERSVRQMRYEVERYLGDWLDRPLVEIRRADCIDRHRKVTSDYGPVAANRGMRDLRACWNSARNRYEELPDHPVRVKWNKTRRKRQPIPWGDLPAWVAKVNSLTNPIRRDWRWFVLLTGLRSEDARTVRWEHVDFEAGTLHRPRPKGGEDRAFTVPLSSEVLDLLARRREENELAVGGDDRGWAWPTRDRDGRGTHMKEPKEQEYGRDEEGNLRKRNVMPSPHRQRDTFATAALEAGVDPLSLKILMNHTLPEGDVTEGYIRPSVEHLRACQEKITAFLLDKAGVTTVAGRIGRRAASA